MTHPVKETSSKLRSHERWAHFRFSVIGPLLAAPPSRGELQGQLQELAAKKWRHPISGEWVVFGLSTIERWYYKALRSKAGPVEALKRKIRSDHGQHPSLNPKLIGLLVEQRRQHPSWSYQLHFDNLAALVEQQPQAGPMPSYASLLRYMKSHGLFKRARRGPVHSPGAQAAERRYEAREVRSYESEYVNGLWHLDFHHGSLRVLRTDGQWAYPILLGILDDHSRLCCHLQWYLAEGARELCHGLGQAFQKRDLPRSMLFDNGSAMIAAETEQGLTRLGVLFENTLPFRPYQNGKQETFWGQVEGRLAAHARRRRRSDAWTNSTKRPRPGSSWNTTARSTPRLARLPCTVFSMTKMSPSPVRSTDKTATGLYHRSPAHPASQRRHAHSGRHSL